jgi:hypothetical protein
VTRAYLTIDAELSSRHFAQHGRAGLDDDFARSIMGVTTPGRRAVGLAYQMDVLEEAGLRATFLIDPMPALVGGDDHVRRMVNLVGERGHDIQLLVNTAWLAIAPHGPTDGRGGARMADFNVEDQKRMIEWAAGALEKAGAPLPFAFRAGGFGANDDTLRALAALGFTHDLSFNPALLPRDGISLPRTTLIPIKHQGIVVAPIAAIRTPGGGLRHAQLTALSNAEFSAALAHALEERLPVFVITSQSHEMLDPGRERVNHVVRRRFERLCTQLAGDVRIIAATVRDDPPRAIPVYDPLTRTPPAIMRTAARMSEQLLANEMIGEHEWRGQTSRTLGSNRAIRVLRSEVIDPLGAYVPIQNMLLDGVLATLLRL